MKMAIPALRSQGRWLIKSLPWRSWFERIPLLTLGRNGDLKGISFYQLKYHSAPPSFITKHTSPGFDWEILKTRVHLMLITHLTNLFADILICCGGLMKLIPFSFVLILGYVRAKYHALLSSFTLIKLLSSAMHAY
ncbi:hypothetical protein YC2023_023106 [Brassica napus]